MNDIAQALGGLSAGIQGRLPQFRHQNMIEEQQRLQSQEQQAQKAKIQAQEAKQMEAERMKTMFYDADAALKHANNGNWGAISNLVSNRLEMSNHFPGVDFTDTKRMGVLAREAEQGNTRSQGLLTKELTGVVQTGYDFRILQGPEAESFTLSEGQERYKGNQLVASNAKADAPKDTQPQINQLRGSIAKHNADFAKVQASFNKIERVKQKPSPAGDLALVFNFMKLLDPGSTVREGEFNNAANAAPLLERVGISFEKISTVWEGKTLTDKQREDFVNQSKEVFGAQQDAFDSQMGNVLQQADQDGIERVRVVGEKRLKEYESRKQSNIRQVDY